MNRLTPPNILLPKFNSVPCINEIVLNNGIHSNILNIDKTQLIRIDFMFKGGAWVQSTPLQALLAFGNLKEGTVNKSAQRINEIIDYYGATFSATVSKSFAVLTLICMEKYLDRLAMLIREVFDEPAYDNNELNLKLTQLKTNFCIQEQQVKSQAEKLFFNTLFGDEHPMAAYPKLNTFDIDFKPLLIDYYNNFIGSGNCEIFVTGDVNENSFKVIENIFGNDVWGSKYLCHNINYRMNLFGDISLKPSGRRDFEMKNKTVQSNVFAGKIMNKANEKEMTEMRITNCLLGGFFGSRLMRNIREKRGLTYGIYSYILSNHHFNILCISSDTNNSMTDIVIDEIKREVDDLTLKPIPEQELNTVKNYFSGNLCRTYEANLSLPNALMKMRANGENLNDLIELQNYIVNMSSEDIKNCASKFFDPRSFLWCVAS